jgi:hypothetical protein
MVNAFDSLLNVVDLYVQAVHYRRIPTSQIPTLFGAEIRQIMPESSNVRQPSPDLDGTVPDSGQAGRSHRISGYLAGSPAIWAGYWLDPQQDLDGSDCSGRISVQSVWDPPRTAGSRPAGQNLARTVDFWSTSRDPAVLCRIPAKIIGIRDKWPDSGHVC